MKINSKVVFNQLNYFSQLDKVAKLEIFKVCCKNNFRYLKNSSKNNKELLEAILRIHDFKKSHINVLEKLLKKYNIDLIIINKNNWLEKIVEINKNLLEINSNKWEASTILNILLVRNNLCPLLHFGFNKWYDISEKNSTSDIFALIEFSTVYLYRLALINNKISITNGVHLVNGSHNSIFFNEMKDRIIKVPTSIAAKYFLNDQEIKVTKLLLKTSLKKYIPNIISFRNKTGIITRQYISGKTGHELLAINFFAKNPKAIKELKIIFNLYQTFTIKTKIKLDIHPGNFIWSAEKEKWFFVDSGPIPLIGSEYFPLDSFEKYFKKIWIQRYERMRKFPIRSVDLDL